MGRPRYSTGRAENRTEAGVESTILERGLRTFVAGPTLIAELVGNVLLLIVVSVSRLRGVSGIVA
jgi:hypothetical protein